MGRIKEWVEDRFGISTFTKFGQDYLNKPVPDHVNYAFTLGTAALVLFMTQVGSGILLALNYTPSLEEAHASVWTITYDIPSGWFIRSFHAWGANLMILVLFLHLLRVFWYGGYKRPREGTWLFGCGLLFLTFLFGFTGYLLPMDQVAYWATTVGTAPFFDLPGAGDSLGQLVRGSDDISNATLSRFYILHVFLLPAAVAGMVGMHLYLVARKGITTRLTVPEEIERGYANVMKERGVPFHHHMYREITTVAVVLGLVVVLAVLFPSELHEKFDREHTPRGVKPEWYFLPVYQLLKYFPKLLGILLVNVAIVVFVMLPFWDISKQRRPSRRTFIMSAGAAGLLVTLVLGLLGYVSEERFGDWEFDMKGMPHRVEEPAETPSPEDAKSPAPKQE